MQSRSFIKDAEGGQVEAGVDEEIGGGVAHHGHEADVDDVGGEFAHDMDAEEFVIVATKEEFEKAVLIANDATAGIIPIGGASDDVRDLLFIE